jgi:hypothetical protein
MSTARAAADKHASEVHPSPIDHTIRLDSYNDELMRWAVALCVTRMDDVRETPPWLEQRDSDLLGRKLKPQSIRWLFEELERLLVESSPLHRPIDDDGMQELMDLLSDGASVPPHAARYLRFALDEIKLATG